MATQWPLILARLVTLAPTLPGWGPITKVYDGPVTTGSPPKNYATLGYSSDGQTGSYTTSQTPDGFRIEEAGRISGEIVCATGSVDVAAMRALCFAALDGLDGAVRADRRLGVLSPEGTSSFTVTLAPAKNLEGTAWISRFAFNYTTVTL